MQANRTNLNGTSWLACNSWAKVTVSVLCDYDSFALLLLMNHIIYYGKLPFLVLCSCFELKIDISVFDR